MKSKRENLILNIIVPIITLIFIIVVWAILANSVADEIILPTPLAVLKKVGALLVDGRFYKAYFNTFLRSLIAFISSFILALVLAIASKYFLIPKKVIETVVPIVRALPTIAVVLVLVLWTSSRIAPVVVTGLVVLPTVYTTLLEALNKVDDQLLEMCKVYGISKKRQILEVYLPIILPTVIVVIGSGISLNIKLMVAAEVLSQTVNSLGLLMQQSKIYFETPTLFALVITSIITGLAIESLGNFISKKVRGKYAGT